MSIPVTPKRKAGQKRPQGKSKPAHKPARRRKPDEPKTAKDYAAESGGPPDLRGKASYLPDIHRLLPQAPDAEKGTLSSFMLSPNEIGDILVEKGISPEHFHLPANRITFATMMGLFKAGKKIDFITLTQVMRDEGTLDQAGGSPSITELFTFLPTAANAGYYIEILEEKFILRSLIEVGTEYTARAYDEQDNATALLDEFETKAMSIANMRKIDAEFVPTKTVVMNAIQDIEDRYENRGKISGIATGLHEYDKMCDGLHPQEMVVIAARPSMGKTALAMNIAEHIAISTKVPIAVFSLEMSTRQLVNRVILGRARCNWQMIRDGFVSDADFPRITAAAGQIGNAPIYFNDKAGISPAYIRAVLKRWVREYGVKVAIIDYLGLLRGTKNYKGDNRQVEVAEISGGLKGIFKDLNIAGIVLAQLNRTPEGRVGHNAGKPKLADLRDSGAIEQDADTVGLLWRPEVYVEDPDEKKKVEGEAYLEIAKQRNGPLGEVKLTFLKEFTRFENRARDVEEEQQPDLPTSTR